MPSRLRHSENLLQSCSSSTISHTEARWSSVKTTSNALAVSWCCRWTEDRRIESLYAFKSKTSFIDLLQLEPYQPVRKSTFPNLIFIIMSYFQAPPFPGVKYHIRNADFGTYQQRCVTDEAISLRPEKDSYTQHVSFWSVSKIAAWLIHD